MVNRVLTTEHLTPEILCKEDVHGIISLLHKGGGTTIFPSDCRPVVLMGYESVTWVTLVHNAREADETDRGL
jgi:hypothetical protein